MTYIPDGVKVYEADLDNLQQFIRGRSILSGLLISAQGAPNMSVKTALGKVRFDGLFYDVAAKDPLAITAADPALPRIDLIHWPQGTNIPAAITGTPNSVPKPPSLPASSLLLGYVSVAAAGVNIQTSNITDRTFVASSGIMAGTLALRPAATLVPAGTLYFTTDTSILYRSDGATWTSLSSTNPLTTLGDIIIGGASGVQTRLGVAADGTVLTLVAGSPAWAAPAAAVGAGVVTWRTPSITVAAGATTFTGPTQIAYGAEAVVGQVVMPRAGTVANLFVVTNSAQGSPGALTFTIRKNGVDTAVVVTVPQGNAAGTFSDIVHSVAFAAGDLLSIKAINGFAGGASAAVTSFGFTFA